jgi:hypothetical protein
MPRAKQPWTHPADDPEVNHAAAEAQKSTDPHCHSGPCAELHEMPLTPRTTHAPPQQHWDYNQAARWLDCGKCNLRLMYWPKHGFTGSYRRNINPQIVQMALEETFDSAGWKHTDHKLMRLTIMKIEAELRIAGTYPTTKAEPKAKYTAKAKPAARAQRSAPPPAREQSNGPRAKSSSSSAAAPRLRVHLPARDPPGSETSFGKVEHIEIDSEDDEKMNIKDLKAQIDDMKRERKKMNSELAQAQQVKDEVLEAARLATAAGGTNAVSPPADLVDAAAIPVPEQNTSQETSQGLVGA